MDQELVEYITQAQRHGLSEFEIKQNLLNAGWEARLVEENFVFARASENKTNFNETRQPQSQKAAAQQSASFASAQNQLPPQTAPAISANHASVVVTGQNFQQSAATGSIFKKPLLWITIVVLLVLAGGAYGYYNYVYITPARVLNKFLNSPSASAFNTDYSINYSDSSATSTGPVSFSLSGTINSDLSNPSTPKQQNSITAAVAYGIFNFSVNFKYLLLGQVIYFDIGQIPQLKSFLPGQNIEWVKVDLNELKNNQNPMDSQAFSSLSFSPALQNQLKAIWSKADILTAQSPMARETLNGVPVYHIKGQINNQALSQALISSIQTAEASASGTEAGLFSDNDKQILTAIINKEQVKELDMWVGQKDGRLYKFHLVLSAPSIQDLSNPNFINSTPGLAQSQSAGRDARRLNDVRQFGAALQLFHNDHGGYPEGVNGQPQNLTPNYMAVLPQAPEPNDASCTDYYNAYWYQPSGKAYKSGGQTLYPSFNLTFCLGSNTGGYQAGIGQLTPQGITADVPCPTTEARCLNSTPQNPNSGLLQAVNQMSFGAQLQIDSTYSDYGKAQNIVAPESSTDILDLLKGIMPGGTSGGQLSSTTPSLVQ